MVMIRTAEAAWEGAFLDGKGKMKLESGALEGDFSYRKRMEEDAGTNPEELRRSSRRLLFHVTVAQAFGGRASSKSNPH